MNSISLEACCECTPRATGACLFLTIALKILLVQDENFLGKCGIQRSPLGSLECLKYNRVDFCRNSQSTPPLSTEMNNSKPHTYNRQAATHHERKVTRSNLTEDKII